MDKLNAFYQNVTEIIAWAKDNGHINDEAESILMSNINEAKAEIDKK